MLSRIYQRNGVSLTVAFGFRYPEHFVHPAAEYQALTRHAGLIDLTHWNVLRITGRDRAGFLNAMLTNDVAALDEGRGCHSLITTIKGKLIAQLYVFARKDEFLLLIAQGDAGATRDVLQKHIITEDVVIEDLSSGYGILALEGPRLEDILWRLFEKGPFPKQNLHAVERRFGEVDICLMKNSVTGEDGCHLLLPASGLERIRRYLVQACRGTDGLPVGKTAWNMRRVENGLTWYDTDFTGDNFPDESRLGDAISYTKGCFRGQETLARLHHRGHVNRALVGLTMDDAEVPGEFDKLRTVFEDEINNYDETGLGESAGPVAQALDLATSFPAGTELFPAGDEAATAPKPVGRITSAVYSPVLRKPLLLGYVRTEVIEKRESVRLATGTNLVMIDLPIA